MNVRKKVLIIDDDPDACGLIRETLEPRGFDVFSCAEPDEALARAGEIGPHLVFISILLPQSNGLKISRAVHAVAGLEKVPIVMLISYADELDPRYTSTIGIVDVSLKPLNAADILSKTASILGEEAMHTGVEEADASVSGPEEPASLDEEWLTMLEKEDAETAELKSPNSAQNAAAAEETRKTADETEDFLLEEKRDKQTPEAAADAVHEFGKDPKGRPMKTFLVAGAALLVLVAGAAAGAFLFFHGTLGKAAAPGAKAPVKKEQTVVVHKKVPVPPSGQETKPSGTTQAKTESAAEKPVSRNTVGDDGAKPAAAKQPVKEKKTYSVQVGAFQNEKNAVALSEKLKKKGYDSFIMKDNGSAVKRVLIGKFDAPGKASVQAKLVIEKEGLKSIIYRY